MRNRARGVLAQSIPVLAFALAVGCGSNNNNPTPPDGGTDGGSDAGALGRGALTNSTAAANGASFSLPFDAAPSPDGATIYFTGVQPGAGASAPAVFKVAASGGTPAALAAGGSIGAPFGIAVSSDGNTVYAADPAYSTTNDEGAIFSVPAAGGNPTVLAETADYGPWSIALAKVGGADALYFIGTDKVTGSTGIFKDSAGVVSVVLEGAAAGSPQAVAATSDGTVYFVDASGLLHKIAARATTATAIGTAATTTLAAFFPAGLAISQDGKFALVPVTDPGTGGESIARVDLSSGAVTHLALSLGSNSEGGGIHRAANSDVYSFVDTGASATGTVYLLK